MKAHIITLFPEVCKPYFQHSIIGRATKKGILEVHCYNPIDEAPTLKRVDDRQYGGGPGMVLKAEPYLQCFEKAKKTQGEEEKRKAIFLTPGGEAFTQEKAKQYAAYDHLFFFCGHYEGIDNRVAEITNADYISIGEYTVTGGELPAMLLIDAIAREVPGVLGNEASREHTRVAGKKVYTRPEVLIYEGKEYRVPGVLLSGHHKNIDTFREKE